MSEELDATPSTRPTPLPPTQWQFPHPSEADEVGVVGIGADLEPSTLIHAYRHGIFPMPLDDYAIGWWSPPARGVLDFKDLKVSRSLRQSCRRYRVTANMAFDKVIHSCASLPREGGWISPLIEQAYRQLHDNGWAHSVEVWDGQDLVGGLYGVQVNGLFAGESMFHLATDASKVALVALVSGLEACGAVLLDVQWATDHLATLGVHEITRSEYLERLNRALRCDPSSLAALSGSRLGKTEQYLDRILLKPIVTTASS